MTDLDPVQGRRSNVIQAAQLISVMNHFSYSSCKANLFTYQFKVVGFIC
jgi:hypothetical protein